MKRKWLGIILAGVMAAGMLTGCGGSQTDSNESVNTDGTKEETAPADGTTEETVAAGYEYTVRELPEPKYPEAAESFAGGTGTKSDPYQISTAAEMALLEKLIREEEPLDKTEYYKSYYVLTADIELNDTSDFEQWSQKGPEYSWRPITNLNVNIHFDGAGHTISGMYINTNNENRNITSGSYGLFGTISDGTIKNLTLDKSYISVSGVEASVGGIAGYLLAESEISDCVSKAVIDVYDGSVGGVAGIISGGRSAADEGYEYTEEDDQRGPFSVMTNCTFAGTITQVKERSMSYIGGVAANNSGNMTGCRNEGTIRFGALDAEHVGGVVASAGGIISDCENAGRLECTAAAGTNDADITVTVGGIAGVANMTATGSAKYMARVSTITDCKNTGYVSGTYATGGIVGLARNDRNDWCMEISDCVNEGEVVSLNCKDVGGIIGKIENHGDSVHGNSIVIEGCRNEADLNQGQVGGIIGAMVNFSGDIQIKDCTNTGNLSTSEDGLYCGGIIADWLLALWEDDDTANVTIEGCTNTGSIDSPLSAGGIIGSGQCGAEKAGNKKSSLVLKDCSNSGAVTVHKDNGYIGGITGSWGMMATPGLIENCHNTGDIIMENKELTMEEAEEISFTLSRMCGGVIGRVGGTYLSVGDDENSAENINKENAWLNIKGCSSTGALAVNNKKEYPNEKGEVRFENFFGGIIGNICAEDEFSVMVTDSVYSGFERGLGNDDLPGIGEKK